MTCGQSLMCTFSIRSVLLLLLLLLLLFLHIVPLTQWLPFSVDYLECFFLIDLNKVLAKCHQRRLDGSTLTVEHLPVCNCLLVTGLSSGTTEDAVLLHFENLKRGGGGEVDKVELSAGQGCALVFFTDPKG